MEVNLIGVNKISWFFETNYCFWCVYFVVFVLKTFIRFSLASFVLRHFFFIQSVMN